MTARSPQRRQIRTASSYSIRVRVSAFLKHTLISQVWKTGVQKTAEESLPRPLTRFRRRTVSTSVNWAVQLSVNQLLQRPAHKQTLGEENRRPSKLIFLENLDKRPERKPMHDTQTGSRQQVQAVEALIKHLQVNEMSTHIYAYTWHLPKLSNSKCRPSAAQVGCHSWEQQRLEWYAFLQTQRLFLLESGGLFFVLNITFFMDLWFRICLFKSWRCEIFEVQKLQSSSQRPRRKHFEKLSFSISFKIEIFGSFVDFVLLVQTIKWAHRDAEATSERSASAAIIISR